ncbi:ATP-binding protein [Actinomadura fibrosa]|uniref:histidine kinase n=1 Tax=Actinomadura fibrosa TaxID=111802 RepID=A0ABW2XN54_9ACTN|nr:ATP-binding protein [Actinomadura fibrosa]
MARSGSPGSRPSTASLWLTPLLMLVAGAAVTLVVPAGARAGVALCGLAATGFVLWEELRRERAVTALREAHAAAEATLRHRLAGQEAAAVHLATELLPAALDRLRHGAVAEDAVRGLVPENGSRLGDAHERMLRSVVEIVDTQVGVHDAAQRAFVNIARRVQAIVHQQALDMRAMEDKHGNNPDVFGDLLHLDHGNALIGRLADSVAVLGGARPGRQWRQDVPLFNVLRGAMSRINDYKRVDLHSVAEFAVVGPTVEPLIHAIAELLDNATRYSPPQARVHLTAIETTSGVAVEIEDAGVGLTDEARVRAETALALGATELDLDDLGETPRLGLAVVGRLARANDFTVALRPSAYGGVRAVLTVPQDALTATPFPGGMIAHAAVLPPPRPRPRPDLGPVAPARDDADDGIERNANGLPQRRRRGGRVPARTVPAPAGPAAPAPPPDAPVQPGMWLADFQEGVSGRLSAGDVDDPRGDAPIGKGE